MLDARAPGAHAYRHGIFWRLVRRLFEKGIVILRTPGGGSLLPRGWGWIAPGLALLPGSHLSTGYQPYCT